MNNIDKKPPSFIISIRFLIAIIAFVGYAVQYIQKIDMSVGIVCMVNNTGIKHLNEEAAKKLLENTPQVDRKLDNSLNESSYVAGENCYFKELPGHKKMDGEFLWTKDIQGLILSAYFYGYLIMEIPGGALSIKYGAKIVLLIAIFLGSVLTVLLPVAARISYIALSICRFLIGVSHSVFWPAMSTLWAKWAPPNERSRLSGIANAGAQIGNVIALPLGGYLCQNGFDGGWPSVFYIFGAIGVVWCILWWLIGAASPSDHKFISEREREYIIEQTSCNITEKEDILGTGKKIFVSKAFYGLAIAHCCSNFGTYLFLTQLPTYMKEILKFDIKSNGGLSALPYLAFWLVTILSSIIGDSLLQSFHMPKTVVRKLFNSLGLMIPMGAVIGLGFVTCAHPYIGVLLLVIGLSSTGCAYGAGFMVNCNDIAGSYAGLTFGISNTFATIPGIIAPYLVGLLTKKQRQEEWRTVFFITAAVYLFGALVFLILGSGETEKWAKKKENKIHEDEDIPLKHLNESEKI